MLSFLAWNTNPDKPIRIVSAIKNMDLLPSRKFKFMNLVFWVRKLGEVGREENKGTNKVFGRNL